MGMVLRVGDVLALAAVWLAVAFSCAKEDTEQPDEFASSPLLGRWVNENAVENRGIDRFEIRSGKDVLLVHTWKACPPLSCDEGDSWIYPSEISENTFSLSVALEEAVEVQEFTLVGEDRMTVSNYLASRDKRSDGKYSEFQQHFKRTAEEGHGEMVDIEIVTESWNCTGYCYSSVRLAKTYIGCTAFGTSGYPPRSYKTFAPQLEEWERISQLPDLGRRVEEARVSSDLGSETEAIVVSARWKTFVSPVFPYGDTVQGLETLTDEMRRLRTQCLETILPPNVQSR